MRKIMERIESLLDANGAGQWGILFLVPMLPVLIATMIAGRHALSVWLLLESPFLLVSALGVLFIIARLYLRFDEKGRYEGMVRREHRATRAQQEADRRLQSNREQAEREAIERRQRDAYREDRRRR